MTKNQEKQGMMLAIKEIKGKPITAEERVLLNEFHRIGAEAVFAAIEAAPPFSEAFKQIS